LKRLIDTQTNPELLKSLFRNLRKGSDMARGDDAGNLKHAVVSWVDDLFGPSEPALKANQKDERGFECNNTGRLLCPTEWDWDDERVCMMIRDGHPDHIITAHSWPAFLYAGNKCNPDNMEEGLFRNGLLVKAFKYLFTSPTSANDDAPPNNAPQPSAKRAKRNLGATQSHVASLIGMRCVTPRAIAYVAVQVRFALSNANT